jgi:predicted enzyme related to lactoylglutathione lyase
MVSRATAGPESTPGRFRFDCVFYYVTDLDRAVAFYTRVLGLVLTSRDVVARLDLDGVLVELVPTADGRPTGGAGNARLTLAVDDLEAEVASLRERGVEVTSPRAVANGWLATFRDPDGNELVLWQYA